jgi:transketolase
MGGGFSALDQLCIDTIRTLSIDAIQRANSGHPGLPLGAAPMAYVLFQRHLRYNPRDPDWPNRDRFVLSAGHGSMLLYSLLHLTGYPLSLDDIKSFRQWGSSTPGHPEAFLTAGVEATTGPLGQGSANAVGMAIAERLLAGRFNRPGGHTIVDHHTYALVSDGDVMEGISAEAASLAGHLKLGRLIYLYDANDVSLDGPTSLTFDTEDVARRYKAYGWHVQYVPDGDHDLEAIDQAITAARAETQRPSLIVVKTTIGFGSPHKAGTSDSHGSPLGVEEVALTKQALGWDPERHFHIPEEALTHLRTGAARGEEAEREWRARFKRYQGAHPELAEAWQRTLDGELPEGWEAALPSFEPGTKLATRAAGGTALNALGQAVPSLVTGSADLSVSTKTNFKDEPVFDGQSGRGRNFYFGVREHAMTAIANGLAYHGGVRAVASTFFVFSDYMRPAVRLAALNHLPVIFVWTHDSVMVGEDGPTHQPVEHLMSLRAMPHLTMIRPADANEVVEAWRLAMRHREGPVGLVFSRQKLHTLDREVLAPAGGLARGAYVLADADDGEPSAVIIGTGSEVHVALEAQQQLADSGVATRVVSMPSWELFRAQDPSYRDEVLPPSLPRVSVEAGVTVGWREWIGDRGAAIGIDRFGASAPGAVVGEKLGVTAEAVVSAVRALLGDH